MAAQDEQDLEVGDSGVVRPGVKDPTTDDEIGGWQGRITEIEPSDKYGQLVCIAWDSLTLKEMPGDMIRRFEQEGLDWQLMYLAADELLPAQPRDSKRDVKKVVVDLFDEHGWAYLGEQGDRIQEVLRDADQDDPLEPFEAWSDHLGQHLHFPFLAEVYELPERGPLRSGEHVWVQRITMIDDSYGIIVAVANNRVDYEFPLCDLKATDRESRNYQLTDDYAVWFANRR
jgi:hypothetical protein